MLAERLSELNSDFVTAIRRLAEQANRNRVARLREAISAFRNDMEAELRSEILVDLESLDVNVPSLVFQQLRRKLKTERVRYVGITSSSPIVCVIYTGIPLRKCSEYSKTLSQNPFWASTITSRMIYLPKSPLRI